MVVNTKQYTVEYYNQAIYRSEVANITVEQTKRSSKK